MKAKYEILMAEYDGHLYVQRPTSWLAGWSRHLIMKKHIPRKVSIASADFWKSISKNSRMLTFFIYEDGTSEFK